MEIAQKAADADDPATAQAILDAYAYSQQQKKEGKVDYAKHIQNYIDAYNKIHGTLHNQIKDEDNDDTENMLADGFSLMNNEYMEPLDF